MLPAENLPTSGLLAGTAIVYWAQKAHVDGGHPVVNLARDGCLAARYQGEGHCNKGGKNGQGQIERRKLAIGTSAESHPHTSTVSVIKRGDPEGGDFIGLRGEYERSEPDSQGLVPCLPQCL